MLRHAHACRRGTLSILILALLAGVAMGQGQTRLKNVCRVKGQEENTLQGLGLVIGLSGTGDSSEYLPAIRSMAMAMQLMGSPLGKKGLVELKDVRNVALVMATARVPETGARQGDKIDCTVSSIGSAKSLEGGRLFLTPLQGPRLGTQRVYALAQGALSVESPNKPTTARIHNGCQMEEDFFNPFVKDGLITLVIEENHADFQVAQEIADLINAQLSIYVNVPGQSLARAINQGNVVVRLPEQYKDDPVGFVAQVLNLQMVAPQVESRVVINERTGSVVISGDVTIGAVVVTHKNFVVETGPNVNVGRFAPLSPTTGNTAELKALVEALNAIKVPTQDMVHIIKGLERNGKLHGKLIVE